jgi:HTH-type transcriptional regulator / antitoxin HipB
MTELSTRALADAARGRRRSLGLTQGEVADLAGVSTKFLIDFERGKPSVRLDKVMDVLNVLGLTLRLAVGDQ